jgi:hypothetical protein
VQFPFGSLFDPRFIVDASLYNFSLAGSDSEITMLPVNFQASYRKFVVDVQVIYGSWYYRESRYISRYFSSVRNVVQASCHATCLTWVRCAAARSYIDLQLRLASTRTRWIL